MVWNEVQQLHQAMKRGETVQFLEKTHSSQSIALELTPLWQDEPAKCIRAATVYIRALCHSGHLREACEIFSSVMKSANVQPDIRWFNVMVDGLVKHGYVDESLKFVKHDMITIVGIEPNVVTFNTLLNGLVKHDFMDEAMEMVELM